MQKLHLKKVLLSLSMTLGLATVSQAQTVVTDNFDLDVEVTGLVGGAVIGNNTNNSGELTSNASSNTVSIDTADDVAGGVSEQVKDNTAAAFSYATDSSNTIDIDGLGGASGNIGNLNVNTIATTLDFSADADSNTFEIDTGGAFGTDASNLSDAEVMSNAVSADASGNFALSTVSGDFSDFAGGGTPVVNTDATGGGTGFGIANATAANYSIGNNQTNDITDGATASADDNLYQIVSGDGAVDDFVTLEADNNSASALGRGNVASNMISGTNGGSQNSFGVASTQVNTASIASSASADSTGANTGNQVLITLASGLGAGSSATAIANAMSATTIGNQTVNMIRVSQ